MAWQAIEKPPQDWTFVPNLVDYEQTRAAFSWQGAQHELDGLPDRQGLNIAHEALDRHAAGARRDHLALRWLGKRDEVRDFTYADLSILTNRFANVLKKLGVGKGERVFLLAGRIPELYSSALGALKNGNVFCPLFSAFGPEPIRQRLSLGDGKVLVTTEALYKRKVAALRDALPNLQHVILVRPAGQAGEVPDTYDFQHLMAEADEQFVIAPTDPRR